MSKNRLLGGKVYHGVYLRIKRTIDFA